jgi:Protein of unknown function (DUF4238)
MRMLDTRAALAVQKLLSKDHTPWDEPKRSAWSRFIKSLLYRNQEAVDVIIGHIINMWNVAIDALEATYAGERNETNAESFREHLESQATAVPQRDAANFLASVIDDERIGQAIFEMRWEVVDLKGSRFSLLTSDRPIDLPIGLGDPKAYIALPISPHHLFVATNDGTLVPRLRAMKPTDVARMMNKTVVSQAREYVWGKDFSQLALIRRSISTAPDRVILTEEQKHQVIYAAKGLGGDAPAQGPN